MLLYYLALQRVPTEIRGSFMLEQTEFINPGNIPATYSQANKNKTTYLPVFRYKPCFLPRTGNCAAGLLMYRNHQSEMGLKCVKVCNLRRLQEDQGFVYK